MPKKMHGLGLSIQALSCEYASCAVPGIATINPGIPEKWPADFE